MTTSPDLKSKRPLSPHLQVYKPQMTSVLSIFHRMAGVALAIGTLMVAWWLIAAATSEEAYNTAQAFAGSKIGTLMIFGWSVALFYHLSNGVRHLIWDTGRLFKIENAYKAGYCVLAATVILTGITWWFALCDYAPKEEVVIVIETPTQTILIEESE